MGERGNTRYQHLWKIIEPRGIVDIVEDGVSSPRMRST